MIQTYNSVHLIDGRCQGCVNCLKKCPVEAIRVRNGKACIIEERCIDCGICLRTCPNKAKIALTDDFSDLQKYQYNIVFPSPVLYTQFPVEYKIAQILTALKNLGFDELVETAIGAEQLVQSIDVNKAALMLKIKQPYISSSCPAVVRLIELKFPALLEHLLPFKFPAEIVSAIALEKRCFELGLKEEEIGLFYVVPCPSEVAVFKRQAFKDKSSNVKVLSIAQVYPEIMRALVKQVEPQIQPRATLEAASWSIAGGEAAAFGMDNYLVVDGVENVIEVLGQIEMGKLDCVKYIEAKACVGGCVGGVLTVENKFVARRKAEAFEEGKFKAEFPNQPLEKYYSLSKKQICAEKAEHRPVFRLDSDVNIALRKIKQIEQVLAGLPGLDCGSCGAPTCKSLAEDIVQGMAEKFDCIFILRTEIEKLVWQLRTIIQLNEITLARVAEESNDSEEQNLTELKNLSKSDLWSNVLMILKDENFELNKERLLTIIIEKLSGLSTKFSPIIQKNK